jgi:hypothetical protein
VSRGNRLTFRAASAIWLPRIEKGAGVDSDEASRRLRRERAVREQRDAAERAVPGERLRREIREAFERQDARLDEDPAQRPDKPTRGADPPR